MSFVRTVLGDRDSNGLGFTHCHEHLFVFPVAGVELPEKLLIDDYDRTRLEVQAFKEAGGAALVDVQPFAAGRHAELLARLSADTGVTVIASTGLHRGLYYPPDSWATRATAEDLAHVFSSEITKGMYAYDPAEPFARRTNIRAGVIKIATDSEGLTPYYRKVSTAGALAHGHTGAPIITHTELAAWGLEQASFLLERGVPPASAIVSHRLAVPRRCGGGGAPARHDRRRFR
jgi:predicted metal-dependent phosphotriesterase family hydrolase